MSCLRSFCSAVLIVILGFIVYGNSLSGEFVWDDGILIKDNAYIKNWFSAARVLTQDIGSGAKKEYGFYRPLQILTYTLDYSFWNLNVFGYHLTNVLLHIAVALCIFWLVNILYDNWILSLLTALFFVIHPLHTEAVSYISGRDSSLAAFFLLLCFIFYIKNLHTKSSIMFILMLLSYIFALLSRENSLILPPVLLLYHYTFKKRFVSRQFLPLLVFAFVYIIFRFTLLKSFLPHPSISTTLLQRLPGFFAALTNYIRLLFLPFNLHMEYGNRLFSFNHPQVISGIFIFLLLFTYVIRKRKTQFLISFSVLWFFVFLLPCANLYPLNAYMAEHWLYLPSAGFFLLIANALSYLYRSKHLKSASLALIFSLVAFYSYLTIKQNDYWQEPIALYQRTLKYAPDSAMAHNNLGNAYYRLGKNEQAIASYKRAIAVNPHYAKAYNNLGFAYYHLGRKKEAIGLYNQALQLDPDYIEAYNNLGFAYYHLDKKEEAVNLYKKAILASPKSAKAYNNLAFVYYDLGKYDLAIEYCQRALELGYKVDPQFLATLQSKTVSQPNRRTAPNPIGEVSPSNFP